MAGFIKVAALLFNILAVQGSVFRNRKHLQDASHFEHYESKYSDYSSSDYFGNAFNFDVGQAEVMSRHQHGRFVNRKILPDWFPLRVNPEVMGPIFPGETVTSIDSLAPVGPGHPSWSMPNGQGRRKPGSIRNMCQNVTGLPKPESGCCGVEATRFPIHQHHPGYPNGPFWPNFGNDRHRRSIDSDEPPNKMIRGFPRSRFSLDGSTVTRGLFDSSYKNSPIKKNRIKHDWWIMTARPRTMVLPSSEKLDRGNPHNYPGGRATDLHQLPWTARLVINPRMKGLHSPDYCGGTIISSRYVLTAAHCLYSTFKDLSQLEVILAEYDTDSYPEDCIIINGEKQCVDNIVKKVEHVIIHKDYDDTYLQNDVALLRLSSDIHYNKFIRPICLPTVDIANLKDEKNIIIAGWGLNGKKENNVKQAANVNYVSNDKCKEQYSYKDGSLFCSIGDHGEDICHGDSGGPLMVLSNNKYYLSGVVSGKRGDHECGSSVSSLFNNVFYHKDWIVKHVK